MSRVSDSQVRTIGLCGTMGSGKSTVLSILKDRIPAVDCDSINRDLLLPGHEGYNALKKAGLLMTREDGTADAAAMSRKMFSEDPAYKKQVEGILQNLILEKMKSWMKEQKGLCVVEVPLLFELNLQNLFDEIWCVTASEQTALKRLQEGRGISQETALARLRHQTPAESKIARSTRVITNDGTLEELKKLTLDCLKKKGEQMTRTSEN